MRWRKFFKQTNVKDQEVDYSDLQPLEGPILPTGGIEQLRLPLEGFDVYSSRTVTVANRTEQVKSAKQLPCRLALVVSESEESRHVTVTGFRLTYRNNAVEQPHDLTNDEIMRLAKRKPKIIIRGTSYRKVNDEVFIANGERYRGLTYSNICL